MVCKECLKDWECKECDHYDGVYCLFGGCGLEPSEDCECED